MSNEVNIVLKLKENVADGLERVQSAFSVAVLYK